MSADERLAAWEAEARRIFTPFVAGGRAEPDPGTEDDGWITVWPPRSQIGPWLIKRP